VTGRTGALAFLIAQTVRNRIAGQVARLRNPRYALALVAGAGYFWFVFIGRTTAPRAGPTAGVGSTLGGIASVGFAITAIIWWLGKGATTALGFQPAEVQFLFTAPLQRRALIAYKLVRSQLVLLVNALISALIIRRWGVTLPPPLRFLTAWGFFTALSLHRLAVALVLTPPLHGLRRLARYAGMALAVAAATVIVVGVGPVFLQLGEVGFIETMRSVGIALTQSPASYAMAPFRIIVAPTFARSPEAWARAFVPVLGIIAVHVIWVLAMPVNFEEEAAAASVELARRRAAFRQRRAGGPSMMRATKVKRDWLPLAPVGRPAVAIAWKNTIALARTGALRTVVLFIVITTIASRLISAGTAAHSGPALATPYLVIAGMMLVLGPRIVRNDLRQDLTSVSLLKSYPLRGAELVAFEIASPTLVLAVFQILMLVVAYWAVPLVNRPALGGRVAPFVFLAPFAILAFNAVGIAIQNGAALMFPSWVRLGPDSGGVEATGQNLLLAVGSLVALAIMLVVPVIVAGVVAFTVRPFAARLAMVGAAAAGIAFLGGEIVLLVRALGGVFDRMDAAAIQ
jgi:hypothetical protein